MKIYLWKYDGIHLNNRSEIPELVPELNDKGSPVLKDDEPVMKLHPEFIEVECEPTDDIYENFIWYKVDEYDKPVKMDEKEFYTIYPNYGKEIPSDTEVLGQMATDAELERMELGQRMTDLELMVLEGGI